MINNFEFLFKTAHLNLLFFRRRRNTKNWIKYTASVSNNRTILHLSCKFFHLLCLLLDFLLQSFYFFFMLFTFLFRFFFSFFPLSTTVFYFLITSFFQI